MTSPRQAPDARASARAWLELARISNSPTVLSNALAGFALASGGGVTIGLHRAALAATGLVFIYIAGMFLNDAADAVVDRSDRPTRPIPSGRISRGAAAAAGAAVLGLGGLAAGLAQASMSGRAVVAGLVGAVLLYSAAHKQTRWAVLVMGVCRGLVYAVAFGVAADPRSAREWLAPAVVLMAYTVSLSLVARSESSDARPRPVVRAAPLLIALSMLVVVGPPGSAALVAAAAMAAYYLWAAAGMERAGGVRHAVQAWIAGFALVDAGVCATLAAWELAVACVFCFLLTSWSQRRIAGT